MRAYIHKLQTHQMLTYLILAFSELFRVLTAWHPKNEEELIQSVQVAYMNYPRKRLNRMWLTLHSVFNQIILCNGDNDYNIEHLSKENLE